MILIFCEEPAFHNHTGNSTRMKHPDYFCGGALMSWWSSEIVEVLPLLIYFIDVSIEVL